MVNIGHVPSIEWSDNYSFDGNDFLRYLDEMNQMMKIDTAETLPMATEEDGDRKKEEPQASENSGQKISPVVPIRVTSPNSHTLILGSGIEQYIIYPRNQTRRKTSTGEGGCQRCTCKKSQCLKLYCSCFALEEYCSGECVCEGCRNKREFDDEVRDAKQKIVKQDPHAFRSKFELDPNRNEENGDGNHNTLELVKHKKGCNCRKSYCNKRYCECLQAGVGCSENCRCFKCHNDHGKREGSDNDDDGNEQLQMTTTTERRESNEVTRNVIKNGGGCGNVLMESTYMNNNGAQHMPDFSPSTSYFHLPDRMREFFPETSDANLQSNSAMVATTMTTMPMPGQRSAMYPPPLPSLPPRHTKQKNFELYDMFEYQIGNSSTAPVDDGRQVHSGSMNLHNNGGFGGGLLLGKQKRPYDGYRDLLGYDGLVTKQRRLQSPYETTVVPPIPIFDRGKRIVGEQEQQKLPFGTSSQLLTAYNNNHRHHNYLDSGGHTLEAEQRAINTMMHPAPPGENEKFRSYDMFGNQTGINSTARVPDDLQLPPINMNHHNNGGLLLGDRNRILLDNGLVIQRCQLQSPHEMIAVPIIDRGKREVREEVQQHQHLPSNNNNNHNNLDSGIRTSEAEQMQTTIPMNTPHADVADANGTRWHNYMKKKC